VTVGGALGDRLGRLRVFRIGVIGIIVGALITFVGGLINSFPSVMVGRGLEGLGVGFFLPASTALLLDIFPMAERGAAQGRMMVIGMSITAFAPTIVGLIIQAFSWPYAYLMTVLSGLVSLFLVGKVKYQQAMPEKKPFDVASSVMLFLAVVLITVGIMQAGDAGLASASVWVFVGAGLVIGVVLVVTSLHKENPLVQFRLFKIGTVAIGIIIVFMRFMPNIILGAFVARFVQQALGLSPTVTGLLMIPPVLAQVVVAPTAGKMLDQTGARKPVVMGVILMAVSLVLLAFGYQSQILWLIIIATILGGAGFSFTNPVQMAALSATPLEQRGMLAGLLPLAGQFGTALFVAVLTAGMGAFMSQYTVINPGATDAAALSNALSILAWISLAATLVTLVAAFKLPKAGTPQPETINNSNRAK